MHIMLTPTSPNTAYHIETRPSADNTRIRSFTPIANAILDFTILIVRLAIFIINGNFLKSSSIRTISAASIAASEPRDPMANPTSALMSTGASFIPSPT